MLICLLVCSHCSVFRLFCTTLLTRSAALIHSLVSSVTHKKCMKRCLRTIRFSPIVYRFVWCRLTRKSDFCLECFVVSPSAPLREVVKGGRMIFPPRRNLSKGGELCWQERPVHGDLACLLLLILVHKCVKTVEAIQFRLLNIARF